MNTPTTLGLDRFGKRVWIAVGAGLGACAVGLFALVGASLWETLAWLKNPAQSSEAYVLNAVALTTQGILRYLAMLIGAALASGGLLVSFLTLTQVIGASAKSGTTAGGLSGELKTTSPGVVAIAVGCIVILAALFKTTELQINDSLSSSTSQTKSPRSAGGPMPSVADLRRSIEATESASGALK